MHFVRILVLDGDACHFADVYTHILVHIKVEVMQIIIFIKCIMAINDRCHSVDCSCDLENVTLLVVQNGIQSAVMRGTESVDIVDELLRIAFLVNHFVECVAF